MRRVTCSGLLTFFVLISAAPARAQTADALPGRFEIAAGAAWMGPVSLGSRDATETTPANTTARLFGTSTTLAGAPAVDGRVGVRLTRSLMVEGEVSLAQQDLRVEILNDVEAGSVSVVPVERVEQFTVGGGLVWFVPLRASRVTPFVSGGGGYLRQLHESATLVVTGRYYQIGGGLVYPLASRAGGWWKTMGLRLEARALFRVDGVAFDSSPHVAPIAGASFFVRF